MLLDLTLGPSFKVNDGSLALVNCLSGGYKFASVHRCIGLVKFAIFLIFTLNGDTLLNIVLHI